MTQPSMPSSAAPGDPTPATGSPTPRPDALPDLLLAAQFGALRAWVDTIDDGLAAGPSVLPGWTTGALVAHLARGLDVVGELAPDTGARTPLTLLQHLSVAGTRADPAPDDTTGAGRPTAAARGADLDAAWQRAVRRIGELGRGDRVVVGPAGVVTLADLLRSRLIELVVHADDLERSLRRAGVERPAPVLPAAVAHAATALREAVRERADGVLPAGVAALGDRELVLLATGRPSTTPVPDDAADLLPLW